MCGRTASASLKELYFHRSWARNTPFPRPGQLHTCYERLKRYDGLSRTVPVLSKKGWLPLSQNLRKDSPSARPCRTLPAFVRCVLRPPSSARNDSSSRLQPHPRPGKPCIYARALHANHTYAGTHAHTPLLSSYSPLGRQLSTEASPNPPKKSLPIKLLRSLA